MGFFKKKADPISERAKTLNQQIAALEAEIKRLSSQEEDNHTPKAAPPGKKADSSGGTGLPRLRSTALPHGHMGASVQAQAHTSPPPPPREQPLEDVNPFREQIDQPRPPAAREEQLGVRKPDTPSLWQRIKNNFRAAPASNPKLLNYLAAGSIHGLRPLRYEKRVARNRFLLLVIVLAVVLWGIVAALLRK
jgi:hypothetical protein